MAEETSIPAQRTGRHTVVLLVGDWLALGLFVFLGEIDHQVLALPRLLWTTALLALPWTVVALALNAYWLSGAATLGVFLRRSLLAWLVAAPLALILRALVQGQATIVVTFMIVTMGLAGLFLLGWRAAYYTVQARRGPM
jgi:hypothetical protein